MNTKQKSALKDVNNVLKTKNWKIINSWQVYFFAVKVTCLLRTDFLMLNVCEASVAFDVTKNLVLFNKKQMQQNCTKWNES